MSENVEILFEINIYAIHLNLIFNIQVYPFNVGDLTISASVLLNYLEGNTKIPWEDLRYLFGEIMYGGHITDDWDRRLCRTYLLEYLQPELVEGELYLAPGFLVPPNTDYAGYHEYVENYLPTESPVLYGLHPNAEIGKIFRSFLSLKIKLNEMNDFVYPTVYSPIMNILIPCGRLLSLTEIECLH